jgi:hypothetical protein
MNNEALTHLTKEYVGRGIGWGIEPHGKEIGLYFVTGRSEASRNREFQIGQHEPFTINVARPAADNALPLPADHALIYYNALRITANERILSNGAQTDVVAAFADAHEYLSALKLVSDAFGEPREVTYKNARGEQQTIDLANFEPDAPNYTSRITVVGNDSGAAFSTISPGQNQLLRAHNTRAFVKEPGILRLITTYDGANVPGGQPLPRFAGEPLTMEVFSDDVGTLVREIYYRLGPKTDSSDLFGKKILQRGADFRVGVIGYSYDSHSRRYEGTIIQNHPNARPTERTFWGIAL